MASADEQQPPGVDLAALTDYLKAHRPELATGTLRAELIVWRPFQPHVLHQQRQRDVRPAAPPLGHVLDTAHDMSREFRVISALHGTPVPVANPLLFCGDTDVIGSPFYLMEKVEGVVLRDFDDAVAIGKRKFRSCRTASSTPSVDCTRRIRRTLDLRTSVVPRAFSNANSDAGRSSSTPRARATFQA